MKFTVLYLAIMITLVGGDFGDDEEDDSDGPPVIIAPVVHHRRIPAKPHLRIFGGLDDIPHAHPYQVAIDFDSIFKSGFCGGSLITERYVLTAAHCLDGVISALIKLGAHDLNNGTGVVIMESRDFTIHENWNPESLTDDVAVIKLPQKVTLNRQIQTIKIENGGNNQHVGEEAQVTGWGKVAENGVAPVAKLQVLTANIISNQECQDFSLYKKKIKYTHLCVSGEKKKSFCSGDSGGPLVINGTQVGIVSFGITYCELCVPSVFTRVSCYAKWIIEHSDLTM